MARGGGQGAVEVAGRPRGEKPVALTISLDGGSERTIYRDGQGRPHRDDGPAIVERGPSGQTVAKWYCQHGQLHRDRGAAVITFDGTGVIDYEGHYQWGQLHRLDGPAEIEFLTGIAVLKRWWIKGQRHRDGLPAEIHIDPLELQVTYEGYFQLDSLHRVDGPAENFYDDWTGKPYRQRYLQLGLLHRADGPALIELDRDDGSLLSAGYFEQGEESRQVEHYPDGRIKREIWPEGRDPEQPTEIHYHPNGEIMAKLSLTDGALHREKGPARISYQDDGKLACEEWFANGQLHRDDGPAKVEYKSNGNAPERQEWWRDGQLHREDGPAVILFNDENRPRYRRYYLNGQAVKAAGLPN